MVASVIHVVRLVGVPLQIQAPSRLEVIKFGLLFFQGELLLALGALEPVSPEIKVVYSGEDGFVLVPVLRATVVEAGGQSVQLVVIEEVAEGNFRVLEPRDLTVGGYRFTSGQDVMFTLPGFDPAPVVQTWN